MRDLKDQPEVRAKLKPTFLLVRHGETEFDRGVDQHQGWDNGGLTKKGLEQAKHLAQVLSSIPIDRVYTSDLGRAVETARAVHSTYSSRFGLRPWNVGQLVGKAKKDVQDELDQYEFEKPNRPLPGGESFNVFRDRYLLTFKSLLEVAKEDPRRGAVLAVTHSWNVILTLAWLSAGASRNDLDEEVLRAGKELIPSDGGGLRITWTGTQWTIRKLPT